MSLENHTRTVVKAALFLDNFLICFWRLRWFRKTWLVLKSLLYYQPLPSHVCPYPLRPAPPLLFSSYFIHTPSVVLRTVSSFLFLTLSVLYPISNLAEIATISDASLSCTQFHHLLPSLCAGFHSFCSCPSHSRVCIPGSQGNLAVVCPMVNNLLKHSVSVSLLVRSSSAL